MRYLLRTLCWPQIIDYSVSSHGILPCLGRRADSVKFAFVRSSPSGTELLKFSLEQLTTLFLWTCGLSVASSVSFDVQTSMHLLMLAFDFT